MQELRCEWHKHGDVSGPVANGSRFAVRCPRCERKRGGLPVVHRWVGLWGMWVRIADAHPATAPLAEVA
jgi:hypothetical protein